MKAVMISIKPEWCKKIASGEKTIEVRKNRPILETPFKCYIYCTKGQPEFTQSAFRDEVSNGKIIGEFVCDFVYAYFWQQDVAPFQDTGAYFLSPSDLRGSCLTHSDFENYGFDGMDFQALYGWNISELEIYDDPLEITQFIKPCPNSNVCESCAMYSEFKDRCNNTALQLKRPPQSWCYVEDQT